jgi:CRP/FNR family cyclic AMP-dependent transcriptional regulator
MWVQGKRSFKFRKNQHVFELGDVADKAFCIRSSKVKLAVLSDKGKEAIAILGRGQFFGEGCS